MNEGEGKDLSRDPDHPGGEMPPADLLKTGKEALLFLPRLAQLLYRLARDPEVPRQAKAVLGFTIAYLLSPIDLIPDFIPVLGHLDDLYVVALGVSLVMELAGEERVRRHWTGSKDVIEVINSVNRLIWKVLPAAMVEKIRRRFDLAVQDPDRYLGEVERAEEILLRQDQYRWVEDETEEAKG